MNRCSPVETRKNLEAAKNFASIGLDFVCIPVTRSNSKEQLTKIMCDAMELLSLEAEKEERHSSIAINEAHLKDLS